MSDDRLPLVGRRVKPNGTEPEYVAAIIIGAALVIVIVMVVAGLSGAFDTSEYHECWQYEGRPYLVTFDSNGLPTSIQEGCEA